jgi:hypothetical protein
MRLLFLALVALLQCLHPQVSVYQPSLKKVRKKKYSRILGFDQKFTVTMTLCHFAEGENKILQVCSSQE